MTATARPPGGSHWRGLGVRTLSAAVLVPLVLLDAWAGGQWFAMGVAAMGAVMAHEWSRMVHPGIIVQAVLHAIAPVAAVALYLDGNVALAIAVPAALWGASLAWRFVQPSGSGVWPVLGMPYVVLPTLALLVLREDREHGLTAILFLFATVWAADTAAYFTGRALGGPKLWPSVSPNKTWAGLWGAMAGSAAAAAVLATVTGLPSLLPLLLIASLLAAVEQGGDLFESALKRAHGFKDSGRLIPGHGGLLDLVDGLVAAAVAAALLGVARGGLDGAAGGLLVW